MLVWWLHLVRLEVGLLVQRSFQLRIEQHLGGLVGFTSEVGLNHLGVNELQVLGYVEVAIGEECGVGWVVILLVELHQI